MNKKSLFVGALVALILSGNTHGAPSWARSGDTIVKCKGVVKKGANDCGANGHSCAGQAAKDNDPNEWIYVPEGICKKLAGGSVLKKKTVK